MAFQPDPDAIRWRLHLTSAPERVWEFITTDPGRESFWVETSRTNGHDLELAFPNGRVIEERILRIDPPHRFAMTYFGSEVTFELDPDDGGGTDLLLEDRGVDPADRYEITAGWLNVLFPLKAAADHGVDLRNHDPTRTWTAGWGDG